MTVMKVSRVNEVTFGKPPDAWGWGLVARGINQPTPWPRGKGAGDRPRSKAPDQIRQASVVKPLENPERARGRASRPVTAEGQVREGVCLESISPIRLL